MTSPALHDAAKIYLENMLSRFKEQLGLDEVIPGCEVLDNDPFGTGAPPRRVRVLINGYPQYAWYRGMPVDIDTGDIVAVLHLAVGNTYEVLCASGSVGVSVPATLWPTSPVFVYDRSTDEYVPFDTIGDAIAYPLLAPGDTIFITRPGTFYETSLTLPIDVPVVAVVPDVVISGVADVATIHTTGNGNTLLVVHRVEMSQSQNTLTGIFAIRCAHFGGTATIRASLACNNEEAGTEAKACALASYDNGDIDFVGRIVCNSDGMHYGAYGVQNYGTGRIRGRGDVYVTASDGFAYARQNRGTGSIEWEDGDYSYVHTDGPGAHPGYPDSGYAVGDNCRGGRIIWRGRTYIEATNADAAGLHVTDGDGEIIGRGDIEVTGMLRGINGVTNHTAGGHIDFEGTLAVYDNNPIGGAAYGVYSSVGGTIRCIADVTVESVAGAAHGIRSDGGSVVTALHGRVSTSGWLEAFDLYEDGGTLEVFCVQHDESKVNGTITWLDGVALESLREYLMGALIRGGSIDWEAFQANLEGRIVQGDGFDVISDVFNWDNFAGALGADMVHDHSSDMEGGNLSAASGTFTTADGKTVTVVNGIVTDITP